MLVALGGRFCTAKVNSTKKEYDTIFIFALHFFFIYKHAVSFSTRSNLRDADSILTPSNLHDLDRSYSVAGKGFGLEELPFSS
jgi:hypothetical protein